MRTDYHGSYVVVLRYKLVHGSLEFRPSAQPPVVGEHGKLKMGLGLSLLSGNIFWLSFLSGVPEIPGKFSFWNNQLLSLVVLKNKGPRCPFCMFL